MVCTSSNEFINAYQAVLGSDFGQPQACNGTVDAGLGLTQIISCDLLRSLNFYVNALLCGLVALFGTVSNMINLIIFYQMRLKDSMSVCLFALSLTDFLLSILILVSRAFPIWDLFYPTNVVDPNDVDYVIFNWSKDPLFLSSGWITAILSLERCISVTFPFKVREIFTRNRAILAVVLIYAVNAITYAPIFSTQWLQWMSAPDEATNGTEETPLQRLHLVPVYSKIRPKVEFYVEIIGVSVLPIPSLVIILVSVVCMTHSLTLSSKARDHLTASTVMDRQPQTSKLTAKSRRLAKVVLSLAVIFTICSIPRFYAAYLSMFNTEVNEFGKERNLSVFNWHLARFATAFNASVNIIVYLRINSSYRTKFKQLCMCAR